MEIHLKINLLILYFGEINALDCFFFFPHYISASNCVSVFACIDGVESLPCTRTRCLSVQMALRKKGRRPLKGLNNGCALALIRQRSHDNPPPTSPPKKVRADAARLLCVRAAKSSSICDFKDGV